MELLQTNSLQQFINAVNAYQIGQPIPMLQEHELEMHPAFNFRVRSNRSVITTEATADGYLDDKNYIVSIGREFIQTLGVLSSKLFQRVLYHFATLEAFEEWIKQSLSDVSSVMMIVEPEWMNTYNQSWILELFQAGDMNQPVRVPFGVITGKTDTLACYHLLKNYWLSQHSEGHLHTIFDVKTKKSTKFQNIYKLGGQEASVNFLHESAKDGWVDSLSLTSGSMDDYTTSPNEVLCGKNHYKMGQNGKPKPQCELGYGCLISRMPQTSVHEVPAKLVFVQGCNTARFRDSDFGVDYDLGYAFLESRVCSYVASPRLVGAVPETSYLFSYLIASGMTVGETTRIINNSKLYEGHDTPVFLLYGDPCLRFKGNGIPEYKLEMNPEGVVISTSVTFESSHPLVKINVDHPRMREAFKQKSVVLHVDKPIDYRYFVVPTQSENGLSIYLLLQSSFEGTVEFAVESPEVLSPKIHHLERVIQNISTERFLGNGMVADKNTLQELMNKLQFSTKGIYASRGGNSKDTLRFHEAFENILSDMQSIQKDTVKSLLTKIRKSGYLYGDLTMKQTFVREMVLDRENTCPVCSTPTHTRIMQHTILQSVKRHLAVCFHCSNIYEYPMQAPLQIDIQASRYMKNQAYNDVTLRLKNVSQGVLNLAMGCELTYGVYKGNYEIQQQTSQTIMHPGETFEWSLFVRFEDLPPYLHRLTIPLIADYELYTIVHNFYAMKREE